MSMLIETFQLQQLAEDQHQHFNTNTREEAEQLNARAPLGLLTWNEQGWAFDII